MAENSPLLTILEIESMVRLPQPAVAGLIAFSRALRKRYGRKRAIEIFENLVRQMKGSSDCKMQKRKEIATILHCEPSEIDGSTLELMDQ